MVQNDLSTSKDGFLRQVERRVPEQPEKVGFKDCDVDFKREARKIDSAFACGVCHNTWQQLTC